MLRDHKVGVCEEIRGQGRRGRWRRCEVLEDHRAEGVRVGWELSEVLRSKVGKILRILGHRYLLV